MNTRKNTLILLVVVIVLASFGNTFTLGVSGGSKEYPYIVKSLGGDCMADAYTGDTYAQPDNYCMTGNRQWGVYTPRKVNYVRNMVTTSNPVIETVGSVVSAQIVVSTAVQSNTPTEESPIVTPPSETTPEPHEDTCKNKNSGKDGTPQECNAGIGQEKQDNK